MPGRESRVERLLKHLDRVIGPVDSVRRLVERFEWVLPAELPPPPPPFPPVPVRLGSRVCEEDVKRVVVAFYRVLREEFGEQRARSIVERAARLYAERGEAGGVGSGGGGEG